jgi:hypothetical protein
MAMSNPAMKTKLLGALAICLLAAGCMLRDARDQQKIIADLCGMEGIVESALTTPHPMVVILVRRADADGTAHPPQIVDHFVLEQPGKWTFMAPPGRYRIAAFADNNADLVYQPGESFAATQTDRPLNCIVGARLTNIALSIPLSSPRLDQEIDVTKLQAHSIEDQTEKTLGQLTVVGEIASLADDRFSQERASDSLWRPLDAVQTTHPGIYFLDPYDARKIPVLFVHGISGSPANFSYLIEHLDRSRFQPWVYSYPSGVYLKNVADHLAQTVSNGGSGAQHGGIGGAGLPVTRCPELGLERCAAICQYFVAIFGAQGRRVRSEAFTSSCAGVGGYGARQRILAKHFCPAPSGRCPASSIVYLQG